MYFKQIILYSLKQNKTKQNKIKQNKIKTKTKTKQNKKKRERRKQTFHNFIQARTEPLSIFFKHDH